MWKQTISRLVLSVLACVSVAGTRSRAADPTPAKVYEVEGTYNLAYYEGADADPVKHKLDLYLPKDRKDFPVVFFIHGGGWRHGDKDFFGMYSSLGKLFARHGYGAVVINYRLSPKVKHPEHIKDVARAFAWTVKNIRTYGGNPEQIFVSGHSAGGHLSALLATDERYLKAVGLTSKSIKGVIAISGVYTIPQNLFTSVFGSDPDARKDACPICHVRSGSPPFLILYAGHDFPTCDKMSEDFGKALNEKEVPTEVMEIKERNHITILLDAVIDEDPCAQAMLRFLAAHTKP